MRKHFSQLLLLLALGLLTFSGCNLANFNFDAEDFNEEWQPGFAIPLLNTTLTLGDALGNFQTGGFISVGNDDLITVVYRGQTISLSGNNIIALPDLAVPLLAPTQSTPIPLSNNMELRTVSLKQGMFSYQATHLNTQDVDVVLTLEDVRQNGTAHSVLFTIPASDGVNPVTYTDSFDLTGFDVSFENGEFNTDYTAMDGNGNTLLLTSFNLAMENLRHSYLDGYFGIRNMNLAADNSTIDLFANWQQGNIEFVDPRLILSFENEYGMPIRLTVDSLSALTHFNGVQTFQSNDLSGGFDLAVPTVPGEVAITSLTLDNTNSNIASLVSGVPYEFYYKFSALANPDGDPNINNFLTDSSNLNVNVDMELPMFGNIGLFAVRDTFEFNFNDYQDVERMKMRLTTENGFPFEVNTQVYFLDPNNTLIDSLFTDDTVLLNAADADSDGNVISKSQNLQEVDFPVDRFAFLKDNARRIVVVGTIETVNGGTQPVKVLTSYDVTFQLGAIIGF